MSDVVYLHRDNVRKGITADVTSINFYDSYRDKPNEILFKEHFPTVKVIKKNIKKFNDKVLGDILPEDFSKLQLSSQSTYSSAFNEDSIITAKYIYDYYQFIINKFINNEVVITDACANVGGNTIQFALNFDKVNAVEFSTQEFFRLKNNIQQYAFNNVNLNSGDYFSHSNNLVQDIIFFDPPWGGPDYKNHKKLGLTLLKEEDITEDIEKILDQGKAKLVVLKGPENTYIKKDKYLRSKVSFKKIFNVFKSDKLVSSKTLPLFDLFFFHIESNTDIKNYIDSLENYSEEFEDNKIIIEKYSTMQNDLPTRVINFIKNDTDAYNVPVNIIYNIDNSHYESIVRYKSDIDDKKILSIQSNIKYNSKDTDRLIDFSLRDDSNVVNKELLRKNIYSDIIFEVEDYLKNLKIDMLDVSKMINNYIFNKIVDKQTYDDAVIIGTSSNTANSKIYFDLKYYESLKNINIDKIKTTHIINFIQSKFYTLSEYLTTSKITSDGPIDLNKSGKHLIYWYNDIDYLTDTFTEKSIFVNIPDFMIEKLGEKIYSNLHKYVACYLRYQYLDLNTVALAFDYANDDFTKDFSKEETLECFASVYNFYYDNWCSAFYDIEDVFGSLGSFWSLTSQDILKYNNIVANPPFDKNIINLTLEKLEEVIIDIKANGLSNKIVIILPHWDDMVTIKRYKRNYNHTIIPKESTRFIDYFGDKNIVQPVNIIVFVI